MCCFRFALSPTAHFQSLAAGFLFVSFCGMSVWNANSASAERWTDLRGTKTIEARMVGMWDDQVILELAGGRRIAVNKASLQAESRIQADELASKINASRQADVELIQRRVAEASAPAPNPLPKPPAAPEYVPPIEGLSAEALNDHVLQQLAAGHLRVIVDSMPASYRKQLDDLVAKTLRKFNPDGFNAITGTLHDIGDTLITHQRWFRSHPRFEAMSEDSAETVQTMILSVAGFLRDGFDPQVMSLEAMQAKPFSQWIVDFDQRTSPYLAPMMASTADMERPEMVFSEPKDGKVTVTWQVDVRNKQSVVLEQIEGYWIPPEIKKGLDEADKKIDKFADGSIGGGGMELMVSTFVQPHLSPLKEAGNEAEFHASMETLVSQATPGLSAFSGFLPKGVGVPSFGAGGSGGDPYGGDPYGDGYGSDYGDEGMEEDLYADPYGGAFGG